MLRLIVTGWRGASRERHGHIVAAALHPTYVAHGHEVTLVHGDGDGLDQIAAAIASGWGWTVEAHPADWQECGPGCPPRPHLRTRAGRPYCPHAGPRRNRAMCAAGADLLLAFPGPGSRGTWDCLHWATRCGIPFRGHPLTR